uniref:uncharacterized protein LOC120336236 n=1 Tax=Styela clava TaxID=7725 RepID=UPI001939408C|nr:uncharacterized protein LOC120336236 [Styela clava]
MKITPVVLLYCCIIANALQFEEFDYKKDFDINLEKEYLRKFLDEINIEAEIDTDLADDADFEPDLSEAIFEDDFEHDYEKKLTKRNIDFCDEFKLCEKEGHGFKTGCAVFQKKYVNRRNSFPNVYKKRAGRWCVNCQEKCKGGNIVIKLG